MVDLTDEQIKAGLAAANATDSTFDYGDGSTAAERETACIDAFRRAAGLPEWESYQLEGVGMVRRRKSASGVARLDQVPTADSFDGITGRPHGVPEVHQQSSAQHTPMDPRKDSPE